MISLLKFTVESRLVRGVGSKKKYYQVQGFSLIKFILKIKYFYAAFSINSSLSFSSTALQNNIAVIQSFANLIPFEALP